MIESHTAVQRRPELTQARRALVDKRLRKALKSPTPTLSIPKRPDAASAPLSFAQQRFWFIDQLEPGSPAYHVATSLRLSGSLDPEALERAVAPIIERHEILRTRFPAVDGAPIQVIDAPKPVSLRLVDLSALPQADRETEAQRRMKEEAQRPFDLTAGPLFRALLLRLSPDEHLFLIVMHHIISDGWSSGVFFRELQVAYEAALKQRLPELTPLPIQYADYSVYQQQQAAGEGFFDEHLRWWKQKLQNAPPSLALPLDHERHDQPMILRGAAKAITISAAATQQLGSLSRSQSTTPFMTLLSALVITLHRWTRQADLVVGTVVAGRTQRELENLIGCFVNFIPIRTRISGSPSGGDILEQVKATVLESYTHQDCPFDKIVEAVNPNRKIHQNPLYNVGFLLQNYPRDIFRIGQLVGAMHNVRTDTALLDLRFVAEQEGDQLTLHCEYDTELFEPETIEAVLETFNSVLERLLAEAATPLAGFALSPALQRQIEKHAGRSQTQTLAVAGTFTCEPLADSLKFWMEKLELPVVTRFAPYNQVFQQLLDPSSLVSSNTSGANILLIRSEDWLRNLPRTVDTPAAEIQEHLDHTADQLLQALKAAVARSGVPFLVCFCPASEAVLKLHETSQMLSRTENQLIDSLSATPGIHVVPSLEILSRYPVEDYDDPQADDLGHVPYTPAFFAALGTLLARKFHALKRPPRKVIALDCDNTLWSGICGEDGPAAVKIDEPRRILQEFMREQLNAGILLCLCSKNNPEDVEAVFGQHDMPLKRDDFAACRLNWAPKSDNLKSLANELNLGLESFIFVDDNPIECAEIEANCPGALALQLPDDLRSMPRFLSHLWIFDHLKVTEEDRKRAALYIQNRQREQFQAESLSFADFLAGLNLQIRIEEAGAAQVPRVAQLTERTNQFNFTTRRRSEAEIGKLLQDQSFRVLTVTVSDRFGDYGLVGVVIYQLTAHALDVDTFLLSCRVLGKGVEHRILSQLGEIAQTAGRRWVDVHFVQSAKNKPAFQFLEKVGSSFRHGTNGSTLFRFPADLAAGISFSPETAAPIQQPAQKANEHQPASAPGFAARFTACRWIATEAWKPEAILSLIESKSAVRQAQQQPYAAPRNETERTLCDLWQKLLRIERVGIHDDFFALGGTSLLAVRLFAQIEKLAGKKLPVVTLFRTPTVEQLANLISRKKSGNSSSAIVAIQPKGNRPPLVLIHGAGGGILWGYANLAAALPAEQPVYAIDPRWTVGLKETHVEEMAERYIAELRSLQAKGPYHLGGYCFGGYVAYEMARQLHGQGETTALVLLIDCAAPNGSYDRVAWWRPGFIPSFVTNSIYWVQDFLRLKRAERHELVKRKWAALWRALLRRSNGRTSIDVDDFIDTSQFPEDELKLWQVHLRAGSLYYPKPYPGLVTLLRTRRQPFLCSFDPCYGWGELAQGGVDSHLIPGSHENIFVEPDVVALAAHVDACLQNAASLTALPQNSTSESLAASLA